MVLQLLFLVSGLILFSATSGAEVGKEEAPAYFVEAAEVRRLSAVDIGKEGLTVKLPGKAGKVIMAYAGAYLLIEFPEQKSIGVFDISAGGIIKYIDFAEPFSDFAAGGKTLLIYLGKTNKLQLWDMTTWELKSEKRFHVRRRIGDMGMGLWNDEFALIRFKDGDSSHNAGDAIGVLSLPDCKLSIPKWIRGKEGMTFSKSIDGLHHERAINVIESGTHATVCSSYMQSTFGLIDLQDLEILKVVNYSGSFSNPTMSSDLRYVITGWDVFELSELGFNKAKVGLIKKHLKLMNPKVNVSATRVEPISGFEGVIQFDRPDGRDQKCSLLVRGFDSWRVLSKTEIPMSIYRKFYRPSFRSKVFASGYVERCVLVEEELPELYVFPIDIQSAKKVVEEMAKPGFPYVRKVDVPVGIKVSVEDGLEGVTFDQEKKTLTWEIPKDFKHGATGSIVLLFTGPDGKTQYHFEKILVP
ncbi:MAG: hypothetical protein ACSHX6_02300 [Akkermansiaceae bacterium]